MSAGSLQPFPPLPFELKGEILSFADTDTLAKACSVSLAFLQLAAPLLYRDIAFEGPEGLEKLLTLRADVQVPELAPYLDLSLIQSVTYIDVKNLPFGPDDVLDYLPLVPHRLAPSPTLDPPFQPLAIHTLVFQVAADTNTNLWAFFDPVSIRIEGRLCVLRDGIEGIPSCSNPTLARWSRLRDISFKDATVDDPLFGRLQTFPGGPVRMSFELSVNFDGGLEDGPGERAGWICEDARGPSSGSSDVIESVLISVWTEKQKELVLKDLHGTSRVLSRTTVIVKPADAGTSS